MFPAIHIHFHDLDKVVDLSFKACGSVLHEIVGKRTSSGISQKAFEVADQAFDQLIAITECLGPDYVKTIELAFSQMIQQESDLLTARAARRPSRKIALNHSASAFDFAGVVKTTSSKVLMDGFMKKSNSEAWAAREALTEQDRKALACMRETYMNIRRARLAGKKGAKKDDAPRLSAQPDPKVDVQSAAKHAAERVRLNVVALETELSEQQTPSRSNSSDSSSLGSTSEDSDMDASYPNVDVTIA